MKNNSEHIELIARFFTRESSKEEISNLKNWIKIDSENEKLFKEYQKAWDTIGRINLKKEIDVNAEWEKLDSQLQGKTVKLEPKKRKSTSLYSKVIRIAAIFIIGAFTAFSAYYMVYNIGNTKLTAELETKEVVLPDGSEITINSNTTIKYPKTFSENERKVKLKGEAYFEVAHNKEKTFIVELNGAEVKVLGTKFNIRAYPEEGTIEVVVDTGKVSFSKLDEYEEIILQTGDVGIYSMLSKEIKKTLKVDENETAWKTKKMRFRNTSLSRVAKTLSKVYHTNIVIANNEIKDCQIEATFDDQSLESIIKVITTILPHIDFNKTENGYIVRGVNCD